MKILLISQFFKPDITAPAFRVSEFVDYLKGQGHDVLAITGYPHKSEVSDYDFSQEQDVIRIEITQINQRSFITYFRHYFSFMFRSVWEAWKNRDWGYEIIFVSSPPLFVGYGAIWLKRILRKPLIVEIRDIWPDSAVAAGQLREGGLIYKLARFIEKQIYKEATAMAAVSKPMAEYISDYRRDDVTVCYNGVKREKILYRKKYNERCRLARCSPTHLGGPMDDPLAKKEHDFTIAYTGNIGLCQNTRVLIETGKLIKANGSENIKIRIIGGGAEKGELQFETEKNNLGDVVKFEGPYPKEQLEKIITQEVDILFLNLKDHPVLHKTIPSKLFDYLLFEKPIIYGIFGEGKELLDTLGIGESFEPESAQSLLRAIQTTIENYDAYWHQAQKLNLNLLEKRFTREENFEKLLVIISEITEGGI